jgi:hypothetical protein
MVYCVRILYISVCIVVGSFKYIYIYKWTVYARIEDPSIPEDIKHDCSSAKITVAIQA